MSTFIVRFAGGTGEEFRGRVQHVGSGQEASFRSVEELVAFLDAMNVVSVLRSSEGEAGMPLREERTSEKERP